MATQTIQNLPPQYVQDIGKDYATQLAGLTGIALDTSRFAPQVAGQDPLQQQASLAEFDRQAAKGMAGIGQTAAMSGNLGGGREGVMRSEYQSQSDLNRALLQSGLLQQGFTQANQLANQAFGQQRTLATQVPELARQDVSQLGLLGGLQQAQAQAQLDATREANRLQAFEPYERLNTYGSGVMGLISGVGNPYQMQVTPNPTPLQTALGTASVLGGIFNPPRD